MQRRGLLISILIKTSDFFLFFDEDKFLCAIIEQNGSTISNNRIDRGAVIRIGGIYWNEEAI